jgi:amidase
MINITFLLKIFGELQWIKTLIILTFRHSKRKQEGSMRESTIMHLQRRMRKGEISSRTIVAQYLRRIEAIDMSGPKLNALIEINPEALTIAEILDDERLSGHARGPLHGIPIVLKDNIDTADQMTTTAGSLALAGVKASKDAYLVQKLSQAGVVILGKANLSEWANFRSTHSVSGWSSRGGQTLNPYALDRNPCGSSSGSAVAVAANLCMAAVGTETDGSIICPSQTNGIVGLKPTLGLISRSGIVPIAHSQDSAGPMGRCVEDVALLLGAMTGADPLDPITAESVGKSYQDYHQFLDMDGLKGARLGVARNYFGFNPHVDRLMEKCLQELKSCGAELVDPVNLENADSIDATELEVLLYEFKADLNAYLSKLGQDAQIHSLSDVIAFNDNQKDQVMPFFGQERMMMANEKGALTDQSYLEALAANHRLSRAEGIDAALRKHNLDAIVAPSGRPAWLTDYANGDSHSGGCTSPAAVAGYPHITVPAGYIYGLPVGLSFFASAYAEPALLRIAYAFEQATRYRQPPKFPRTVHFDKNYS